MKDVLRVKNLTKSYGDFVALQDFELSVRKGEYIAILGPNGAGKSTTIESILGVTKPDFGIVEILGFHPLYHRKKLFQYVGVQFQESSYPENIKVSEMCQLSASYYKNPTDWVVLLNDFGLQDKKNHLVSTLSGGEKQRLFVVLALIPQPKMIFLDELTTGLDPHARRSIWELLLQYKRNGLTVILTSHYMEEVEKLCDRIVILNHGKTRFIGTIQKAIEVSKQKNLEEAYLWFTGKESNE